MAVIEIELGFVAVCMLRVLPMKTSHSTPGWGMYFLHIYSHAHPPSPAVYNGSFHSNTRTDFQTLR